MLMSGLPPATVTRTSPRVRASADGAVARAVGVYGLSIAAVRALSLVATPLVTWAVAAEELGAFAVLNSLMALSFTTVVDLGLDTAALRLGAEEGAERRRRVFSTLLVGRIVVGAAAAVAISLLAEPAARLLTGDVAHARYIPWLSASLVVGSPARALSNWLRVEGRHRALAGVMALLGVVESTSFIVLVFALDHGLDGLVAGRVTAQVVSFLPLVWMGRVIFLTRPDRSLVVPLLRLGFPFALLYFLCSLRDVDRYLVAELASLEYAGVYDVAVRVAAPLGMANLALTLALEPWVYAHARSPELPDRLRLFVRGYAWAGLTLASSASLMGPEILMLVGPEYRAAWIALPAVLSLEVVEGLRRLGGLGGELAKQSSQWLFAVFVNASLAIGLSILLVPIAPLWGAPTGLLVGAAAGALLAWRRSEAMRELSLPVGEALLATLAAAVISAIVLHLAPAPGLGTVTRVGAAAAVSLVAARVLRLNASTIRAAYAALRLALRGGGASQSGNHS